MSDCLQWFVCKWRHGPAPGLAYYEGTVRLLAEDADSAKRKTIRRVCHEGAFQPGCITVYDVYRGGDRS